MMSFAFNWTCLGRDDESRRLLAKMMVYKAVDRTDLTESEIRMFKKISDEIEPYVDALITKYGAEITPDHWILYGC